MFDFITDLLSNPLFLSAAGGWLISQGSKVLYQSVKQHGLSPKTIFTSGGMPSSHTATVTGLLFGTLFHYGAGGFEFPMALFFAFVVIYDALNVRYQVTEHGKALNWLAGHECRDDSWFQNHKKFDEHLGHTFPEVAVGMAVGFGAAVLVRLFLR